MISLPHSSSFNQQQFQRLLVSKFHPTTMPLSEFDHKLSLLLRVHLCSTNYLSMWICTISDKWYCTWTRVWQKFIGTQISMSARSILGLLIGILTLVCFPPRLEEWLFVAWRFWIHAPSHFSNPPPPEHEQYCLLNKFDIYWFEIRIPNRQNNADIPYALRYKRVKHL